MAYRNFDSVSGVTAPCTVLFALLWLLPLPRTRSSPNDGVAPCRAANALLRLVSAASNSS